MRWEEKKTSASTIPHAALYKQQLSKEWVSLPKNGFQETSRLKEPWYLFSNPTNFLQHNPRQGELVRYKYRWMFLTITWQLSKAMMAGFFLCDFLHFCELLERTNFQIFYYSRYHSTHSDFYSICFIHVSKCSMWIEFFPERFFWQRFHQITLARTKQTGRNKSFRRKPSWKAATLWSSPY